MLLLCVCEFTILGTTVTKHSLSISSQNNNKKKHNMGGGGRKFMAVKKSGYLETKGTIT